MAKRKTLKSPTLPSNDSKKKVSALGAASAVRIYLVFVKNIINQEFSKCLIKMKSIDRIDLVKLDCICYIGYKHLTLYSAAFIASKTVQGQIHKIFWKQEAHRKQGNHGKREKKVSASTLILWACQAAWRSIKEKILWTEFFLCIHVCPANLSLMQSLEISVGDVEEARV